MDELNDEDAGNIEFSLSLIMKITGTVPILLGIMIMIDPINTLAAGSNLTSYGLLVGRYAGALAIIFGLTHWLVSIYVEDNLHIFGRFFALGHLTIAIMDSYSWLGGFVEMEMQYIIGSVFPFALAFVLIICSQKPKSE